MDLLSADLCATGWYCTCPERVQPQSRRPGPVAPTALPARPARAVQAAVRLPPGRCRCARWPSDHSGQRPAGEWTLGTRKESEDQRAPYLLDPLQSHPLPAAGDQAAAGPGRPEAARCRLRRRAAPLGERPPARARRGALWVGVRRRAGSEWPAVRRPGCRREGALQVSSERAALGRGTRAASGRPSRLPHSGSQPRFEPVCQYSHPSCVGVRPAGTQDRALKLGEEHFVCHKGPKNLDLMRTSPPPPFQSGGMLPRKPVLTPHHVNEIHPWKLGLGDDPNRSTGRFGIVRSAPLTRKEHEQQTLRRPERPAGSRWPREAPPRAARRKRRRRRRGDLAALMASPGAEVELLVRGQSDLGDVAPEIKASERPAAVAIADLEWREMEGDDCELQYGDGMNEAQDSDFPTVERSRLQEMLSLLGLETHQAQKLGLQDALQISSDSVRNWAPQAPRDLPWAFLRKLQARSAEARSTAVLASPSDARPVEKESQMEEEVIYWDTADDISADIYSFSELPTPDTPVNPLDLLCALLLASDGFLQQEIVLRMSLCQFALPLVLPDSEHHAHTFLLWAMRGVVRTWWAQPPRGAGSLREDSVVLARAPAFAFVRMEVSSNSKSQLLNAVLSPGHRQRDCFWHRDLSLGTSPREIADGLVEVSWLLPSGREDLDLCPEPVAFLNLRGDIGSHWLQFKLLTEVSSAVFILTDNISKKEYKLLSSMKGSATKYYFILSPYRGKRNSNLRFLNRLTPVLRMDPSHVLVKVSSTDGARFTRRVRAIVASVARSPCRRVSVEDMAQAARRLGLKVDEDCEECQRAKDRMERITRSIRDPDAYRREELRLQGEPWRKAARVEKELCQAQWAGDPADKRRAELRQRLLELRTQQSGHDPAGGVQEFIAGISCPSLGERQYFLRWMEWGLAWVAQPRPRQPPETAPALRPKQGGAGDREPLWPEPLGVEHFLREMGQFYEAESCLVEAGKLPAGQRRFAHFPGLALELLVRGLPLELVDGSTRSTPLRWVTGLLKELHTRLERRSRLVVLSALGVPGTGKSTLLNTMFGLRFATGRGRGPRGAFMQLVTVTESFSQDLGCDHILVIDSGGLIAGAPATAGERFELEASLATLIMGLSDVTVVSLAETRDIPPAILHAFLRLEKTGHMPNYQFVYQNLHDTFAPGPKPRERRPLLESPSDVSRASTHVDKQGDGLRTLADLAFCDPEKQHVWHVPGLWHGAPPMAAVSLGYSEAVFELKRCLLENIRNGLSDPHRNIQQLIELVGLL